MVRSFKLDRYKCIIFPIFDVFCTNLRHKGGVCSSIMCELFSELSLLSLNDYQKRLGELNLNMAESMWV